MEVKGPYQINRDSVDIKLIDKDICLPILQVIPLK